MSEQQSCCMQLLCVSTALVSHLLFMFVAATARMRVPCISTWLISSLLLTWRSHAPAKLTPVGSSRIVTTGLGADELAQSKSRTSSCTAQQHNQQHEAINVAARVKQQPLTAAAGATCFVRGKALRVLWAALVPAQLNAPGPTTSAAARMQAGATANTSPSCSSQLC